MHSLLEPSETFSRDTETAEAPAVVHAATPPQSRSGGMGSTSMDRFATCPGCNRRVGGDRAGNLQRHDVPFTKRRNPKLPQACPIEHVNGQSILGA